MEKSNKELAIELLAGYIAGTMASSMLPEPSEDELKQKYSDYLEFVKKLPD